MKKMKIRKPDIKKIQEAVKKYFSELKEKVNVDDIDRVENQLPFMKKGPLKDIWAKVVGLLSIVKDKEIDFKDKIGPLAALVYVITPIDIIPDGVPFAGLIDDVAVVGYIATLVYDQIAKQKSKKRFEGSENVDNQNVVKVYTDELSLFNQDFHKI